MNSHEIAGVIRVARTYLAGGALAPRDASAFAAALVALADNVVVKIEPGAFSTPAAGSLRESQTSLPWTIRYSRDFRANPQPHKDFAHAVTHVVKALGKLAALVDDMDHDRDVADAPTLRADNAKYVADLVVCALRMANTFPGGTIDLQAAVEERIRTKNATTVVTP